MANVVSKTNPRIYRSSVNTPDYPQNEWLVNPPGLDDLLGRQVPTRYWKHTAAGDDVEEMSAAEKAVVDQQIAESEKDEAKQWLQAGEARHVLRALIKAIVEVDRRNRAIPPEPAPTAQQIAAFILSEIDNG